MTNVFDMDEQRKRKAAVDESLSLAEEQLPLFGGGGGSTYNPMDVIDAKISAAEARTDTKFAQIRGDLAGDFGDIKTELAKKPGMGALIGTGIAIVGIILAAMAFGGDRFDAGMSARSAVEDIRADQRSVDELQNAKLVAMDGKLNTIIDRLPPPAAPPRSPPRP